MVPASLYLIFCDDVSHLGFASLVGDINTFSHVISLLLRSSVSAACRAVGRSENPGVPVVIRWAKSVPPC